MELAGREPECIFVYGSLMRGLALHHHLAGAEFAGEGTIRGKLVALGWYPGLIEGDGVVRGELYRAADLPSLLDVLDDVEEFNPTDPEGSLYVRTARTVTLACGATALAWVYVYNGDATGAPLVAGGDWRAFSQASA